MNGMNQIIVGLLVVLSLGGNVLMAQQLKRSFAQTEEMLVITNDALNVAELAERAWKVCTAKLGTKYAPR